MIKMLLPKEDLINIGIIDGDNEKINEIILKEFDEKDWKKYREE